MFLLLIVLFACIGFIVVHLMNRYKESGSHEVIQEVIIPEDGECGDEYEDEDWDDVDDGYDDGFDSYQDDGYDGVDYEDR